MYSLKALNRPDREKSPIQFKKFRFKYLCLFGINANFVHPDEQCLEAGRLLYRGALL